MARIRSGEEFWLTPREKIDCIIEPGILPVGGIMLLTGEPQMGKSWLAQQIMFELASGEKFLGLFPVRKSRTVYLELEKRNKIARERLYASHWVDRYWKVASNWGYCDELFEMETDAGVNRLRGILSEFEARVAIVDSYPMTINDESDLTSQKKVITNYRKLAKELNIAFILVQHLVKRGQVYDGKQGQFKEPPLRLDDLRGSKYLTYEIDTALGIIKADKRHRRLVFLKSSFSPLSLSDSEPMLFRFDASTTTPFQLASGAYEILTMLSSPEMLGNGKVSLAAIESLTGLSRPTVRQHCEHLSELGIIDLEDGGGRGNESCARLNKAMSGRLAIEEMMPTEEMLPSGVEEAEYREIVSTEALDVV